jgi:hypothetical protein
MSPKFLASDKQDGTLLGFYEATCSAQFRNTSSLCKVKAVKVVKVFLALQVAEVCTSR